MSSQLIRAIKAHLAKGDQAKDKSEQHYISAGQHLKTLKETCPDQAAFLAIVQDEFGLGKSRTYELLQIADGSKTVEGIREDTAGRMKQLRERQSCPSRDGQTAGEPRAISDQSPWSAHKQSRPDVDDMPTAEEADASYQETLYDQACLFLESMTGPTRQRFFAHLERKYRDQRHTEGGRKGVLASSAPN